MNGLTPAAEAFAAKFRAGKYGHSGSVAEPYVHEQLSPAGAAFAAEFRDGKHDKMRNHLRKMDDDDDYRTKVHDLRKDCDKCDMDIADKLSKCKGTSCSVMGGKKRSKKRSNMRSKKNRSRRTTSHRRRSRARR
jgi:hypothetical protein